MKAAEQTKSYRVVVGKVVPPSCKGAQPKQRGRSSSTAVVVVVNGRAPLRLQATVTTIDSRSHECRSEVRVDESRRSDQSTGGISFFPLF